MTGIEERSPQLSREIETVLERNPQSRAILQAFEPMLEAMQRLVVEISCPEVDPEGIDRARLRGGVPLIRQMDLLGPDDPWDQVAGAMIRAIGRGFPALFDELRTLQQGIDRGDIRLADRSLAQNEGEITARWSERHGVRPEVIDFLWSAVTKPLLERKRRSVRNKLEASGWDRGYCPCCGAFPSVAVIHEKIPQRWLHCSRCGHDWRFSRVCCPFCSHDSSEEMSYFFVEGREQETAFICARCKHYLITLNHLSDIEKHDPEIWAMGMAHLDLLMQRKGFVPMAPTLWNVFQ